MLDIHTDPNTYAVLPQENQATFEALLAGFTAEHQPASPTERFLVLEMARAQWRLARVSLLETSLLENDEADSVAALAAGFMPHCNLGRSIQGLQRCEAAARRAFYQALRQLQALRRTRTAPPAAPQTAEKPKCETKPMPASLQRELDAHRRRDPFFDPELDRSQLSREFQRFLDRRN